MKEPERSAASAARGARVPFAVPGCDLRSLPLSPLEAFVFSRVDGTMSEDDLILCTGIEALAVTVALDRLASFGALRFADLGSKRSVSRTNTRAVNVGESTPAARPSSEAGPRSAFVQKQPKLADRTTARAPKLTPVAPPRTSVGPARATVPARGLTPVPTSHRPTTLRPDCMVQMGRYLDGARIALEEGNPLAAANYYRLAQQIAPNDPEIQKALDACTAASAETRSLCNRAAKHVLAGDNAARAREWDVAATAYKEAAQLTPRDPAVLYKVAGALFRRGGNLSEAAEYAQSSVKLVSNRVETWVLLAQIYLEAGARASAVMAAEKAKKLRPDDERVVKVLAKLAVPR